MRTEDNAAPDAGRVDVRLVELTRRFGDVTAVDAVSLDIVRGEFFTRLGPSGSGKTTTLRLIAGFELPDAGRIELAGTDVTGRPPYARDVDRHRVDRGDVAEAAGEVHEANVDVRRVRRLVLGTQGV